MTLDLAKLRAETLALIDGTTPGPWSVFINDAGDKWTGWPLSVNADNIADKTIVRPGGHWPYEWDAKTSQHEACQNARLIAAAPALAGTILRLVDDNLRLLDEIERLRGALQEVIRISAHQGNGVLYSDTFQGWVTAFDDSVDAARAALAEGCPDDR